VAAAQVPARLTSAPAWRDAPPVFPARPRAANVRGRRDPLEPKREAHEEGILKGIGAALIVLWLVLWLFVKITFVAIHLLLLIGLAILVFGLIRRETSRP
jgi:Flp pilus assembly protein TadB